MTSGSLLPMMCLISSRADLTLKSQSVMSSAPVNEIDTLFNVLFSKFAILIVFSRAPSSASCVVRATACSCGVVFPEILLGTCCSVALDCSSLTSRGSLFVVILLVLSHPDGLGVSCHCFRLHCLPLIVLFESRPGWVLSSLLSSRRSCPCSDQCWW